MQYSAKQINTDMNAVWHCSELDWRPHQPITAMSIGTCMQRHTVLMMTTMMSMMMKETSSPLPVAITVYIQRERDGCNYAKSLLVHILSELDHNSTKLQHHILPACPKRKMQETCVTICMRSSMGVCFNIVCHSMRANMFLPSTAAIVSRDTHHAWHWIGIIMQTPMIKSATPEIFDINLSTCLWSFLPLYPSP